jgi:hypothetical protein
VQVGVIAPWNNEERSDETPTRPVALESIVSEDRRTPPAVPSARAAVRSLSRATPIPPAPPVPSVMRVARPIPAVSDNSVPGAQAARPLRPGPTLRLVPELNTPSSDVELRPRRSRLGYLWAGVAAIALVAGGWYLARYLETVAAPAAAVDTDAELRRLAVDADRLLDAHDWDSAIATCDQGLRIAPHEPRLVSRREKAEREKKNSDVLLRFLQAARAGSPDDAAEIYQQLDKDSVYQQQSQPIWDKVRVEYIDKLVQEAEDLPSDRCDEIQEDVYLVLQLDPHDARALSLQARCARHALDHKTAVATAHPAVPSKSEPARPAATVTTDLHDPFHAEPSRSARAHRDEDSDGNAPAQDYQVDKLTDDSR